MIPEVKQVSEEYHK